MPKITKHGGPVNRDDPTDPIHEVESTESGEKLPETLTRKGATQLPDKPVKVTGDPDDGTSDESPVKQTGSSAGGPKASPEVTEPSIRAHRRPVEKHEK